MSRKTVRVEIHKGEPDETIKLGKAINKQHTALGVGSPLTGNFDMPAFNGLINDSDTLRTEATKKEEQAQKKYNQAEVICGIAKGQNKQSKDTLYVWVLSIRDFLLIKYRSTPESLSEYGFNVVISQTGGRRNVSVEIPLKSPEALLKLCDDIFQQHTDDGVSSVLLNGPVDMVEFDAKRTEAKTLIGEHDDLMDSKQSKNNQALNILGYGEGQTSLTEGTVYFFHCAIRDFLLNKYEGTEEQLSEWGFDVVIGAAKIGKKSNPQPVP